MWLAWTALSAPLHCVRPSFMPDSAGSVLAYPTGILVQSSVCNAMNAWILQRMARVSGLYVGTGSVFCNAAGKDYLKKLGSGILWLIYTKSCRQDSCVDHRQSITVFASHCPNLVRLIGSRCFDPCTALAIAEAWPRIHDLTVRSGFEEVDVLSSYTDLRKLCLLHGSYNDSVLAMICHNPCLLSFRVRAMCIDMAGMLEMVLKCALLTEVSISGGNRLQGDYVHLLLQHCKHLRQFELRNLSSHDCEPFPTCGSLRVIKLLYCRLLVEMVNRLLEACPRLITLEIGDCMSLRGDEEDQILTIGNHSCALQRFALDGYFPSFGSEEILFGIAEHCPDLPALWFAGFFCRDCAGIAAVVRQCPLLQELNLAREEMLLPDAFSDIAHSCHNLLNLRVLRLGSSRITDEGVAQIMQTCSALEELDVYSPHLPADQR